MNTKKGFTLVELIVVITILAILGTIGYISFLGYNVIARDTVRKSDINSIIKVVELSKLETGSYPVVTDPINITFSGSTNILSTIWRQGSFGKDSHADARRISEIPTDPLTGNEYAYSVTSRTGEYQVGAILEKSSVSYIPELTTQSYAANIFPTFATSFVRGNYNGKFITHTENIDTNTKNIYVLGVPSILSQDILDSSLSQIHANNRFVYSGGGNAPATYSGSVTPGVIWDAEVTDVSGNIAVIYEGTNEELSTGTGKIEFISNLQNYYENSDVADTGDFQNISNIDITNQENEAIALVNTFLNVGVGGLNGEILSVQQSNVALVNNSGGSTGGNACITSEELTTLNTEIGGSEIGTYYGNGTWTETEWCSLTAFKNWYSDSYPTDKGTAVYHVDYDELFDHYMPLESTFSILANISNITELDIIGSIPSGTIYGEISSSFPVGDFTALQSLNLGHNHFPTGLPSTLWNLSLLETLDLSWTSLNTPLSSNIGSLVSLKNLTLSYAYISGVIPSEIGLLVNLETLILDGNSITSLPVEIGNLSQLQSLVFDNNSITALPVEIGNLSQLQSLVLNNNSITSLPVEIGNLSQLQIFKMSVHDMTSLPDSFANLNSLTHLGIFNNSFPSPLFGSVEEIYYYTPNTSQICDTSFTTGGNDMCIGGNGTTIDITVN